MLQLLTRAIVSASRPLISGLLMLGDQVVDEHVEGYHRDLAPELPGELRIAGGLPDRALIPGAARRAGDLVEHPAVPLAGADLVAVPFAEMGMERAGPGGEVAPWALHGVRSSHRLELGCRAAGLVHELDEVD